MTARPWLISAFLRRDWAIARSYRFSYALEAIDSLVYLALFFYLGRVVDQAKIVEQAQLSEGYFAFAVVGLAMLRMMSSGLSAFALQLRRDQTTGTLEALLVTPAPQSLVVLGSATYNLLLAALSSIFTVVLATLLFGLDLSLDISSLLVLVVALPASFVLFTALGVAIAAFTIVFKESAALLSLVTTGLAVFAGVYFPVEVLPPVLETFANALPFTWALDVVRAAVLNGDVSATKLSLLVAFDVVAVPLALALFGAAVRQSKRAGTLAQY